MPRQGRMCIMLAQVMRPQWNRPANIHGFVRDGWSNMALFLGMRAHCARPQQQQHVSMQCHRHSTVKHNFSVDFLFYHMACLLSFTLPRRLKEEIRMIGHLSNNAIFITSSASVRPSFALSIALPDGWNFLLNGLWKCNVSRMIGCSKCVC